MGYEGKIPATHYGTADVHLDVGPGVVYWIVVQPSGDDWELIIRDGGDTSAEIIQRFSEALETTRKFSFDPPQPYERGLFVDIVTDIRSFTICYDHLE